jgi:CheY-like chemotaxis protein
MAFIPPVQTAMRLPNTTVRAVAPSIAGTDTPQEHVADDRETVQRGDPVVLIVEDDSRFASILLGMAREAGFKGIVTGEGTGVVPLAKRFRPDAITLDIALPDMDGFALLDLLKRNPETRHIPVHVISADDRHRLGLSMGAYGVSGKPVERDAILATLGDVKTFGTREKRLLVVEPAGANGSSLSALVGDENVHVESVSNAADMRHALTTNSFDAVVVNLDALPPQQLGELVPTLRSSESPLIIYAGDLVAIDDSALSQLARSERIRIARGAAQLQDAVALLLHRPFDELNENAKAALRGLRRCDPQLAGRKIVVIDDDIRNIFSLASALEDHGVELHYAESGRSGIELLQRVPDADAALIDIMMPGMDGYQTIREIRASPLFASLPIIAVTAKAMKGDRQKCIEAGASDYVAKPVDIEQIVSVLRVSFQRKDQVAAVLASGADNVVSFPIAG